MIGEIKRRELAARPRQQKHQTPTSLSRLGDARARAGRAGVGSLWPVGSPVRHGLPQLGYLLRCVFLTSHEPLHPRVLPSCQPYSPTPGPGLVGWSPTLRTPGLQMLVGWSRTSRTRVTVGHAVTVVTAPSPGTPARLTGHCDPRDAISGWTVVRRWIWEPEEA